MLEWAYTSVVTRTIILRSTHGWVRQYDYVPFEWSSLFNANHKRYVKG